MTCKCALEVIVWVVEYKVVDWVVDGQYKVFIFHLWSSFINRKVYLMTQNLVKAVLFFLLKYFHREKSTGLNIM
jgi:hypothetical protein